jgi:hypothetical protein
MSGLTAPIIPAKKVRELGRAGGHAYVEHDGREYRLARAPTSSEFDRPRRGEIVVASVEEIDDGAGYLTRRQVHVRAEPVPTGTFEALSSKVKPKPREAPLRVWDLVAAMPAFRQREPARIRFEHSPEPLAGAMLAAVGAETRQPWIEVNGNESPPQRSAAGYIQHLRKHGILLDTAKGRLIVKSRIPISLADRELILAIESLLVGELDGKRVLCAFDDGLEATTVCWPHLPTCEAHARGD